MWGNMGTLWGLCNKFLPLWWGKCGDLDFLMPTSRGECGEFASVQLRGDWERSVVRSFKGLSNRYFTEMIRWVPLTNEKVDIFNFALCLEADNERVDIL